jgi:hypothetical protein
MIRRQGEEHMCEDTDEEFDLNDANNTNYPPGVSEVVYDTEGEIEAFIAGLNYAQDIDVEAGTPFFDMRQCKWCVRVRVGEF